MDNSLVDVQCKYEQRFSCPICFEPSLKIIYGICQHRICDKCLYTASGELRKCMTRCPTCQREHVFPEEKPDIPEDNIEMMKALGIRQCPNKGCGVSVWYWELEKHTESHARRKSNRSSPKVQADRKPQGLSSTHYMRVTRSAQLRTTRSKRLSLH
ncbi:hypothetical protein CHS0354_032483 [Potamilus streckersoni]|uniref:RING-type domain-containing protein n=1 Tax=Potamilus streckersoni TaxID=2493646 RepID=A0AAE0SQA2_9BIVA|nr:hypothetical protein CHS0354_032483 [Potamilus streckersoni]